MKWLLHYLAAAVGGEYGLLGLMMEAATESTEGLGERCSEAGDEEEEEVAGKGKDTGPEPGLTVGRMCCLLGKSPGILWKNVSFPECCVLQHRPPPPGPSWEKPSPVSPVK